MAEIDQYTKTLSEAGLLQPNEELLAYLDQGSVSGRPRGIALSGERLFSFSESGISREVRFDAAGSAVCGARSHRTARYEFQTGSEGTVSILLSGDPGELGTFCDELDRLLAERFEGFEARRPPEEEKTERKKPEFKPPTDPESPPDRAEKPAAHPSPEPGPSPYDYHRTPLTTAPSRPAVIAVLLSLVGLLPLYGVPFALAGVGLALYNRYRSDSRQPDWDPVLETLSLVFGCLSALALVLYALAVRQPAAAAGVDAILRSPNPILNSRIAGVGVGLVVLLVSVSFHEASHALVAYWNGDSTAAHLGRITLNPVPHIDPFGSVILPLLLVMTTGAYFAYAKPVPVNPNRYRNLRVGYITVSFSGPGSNFMLALLGLWIQFVILAIVGTMGGPASGPDGTPSLAMGANAFFEMFVLVNVFLGCFNLIPIPPLDGYHILEGVLPWKWTDAIRPVERYGFFILLILLMSGGLSEVFWYVNFFVLRITRLFLESPFGL
jgi:Zn-dependent protease